MNQSRKRNISLDIVRIIAVAAVVMIHTSANFVKDYDLGSPEFVWGNILDSISRIGVPLFIMTSGALLLDEEKIFSIKNLFTKRLPQLVFLLIVWSAIYAVSYKIMIPLLKGESISIRSFVRSFVFGHYHLWYLYMQIGLYLVLPFLRTIVCRKNKNLVLLYLAISLLTQFTVPVIKALSLQFNDMADLITFIKKFQLGFFNVYVSYFLAGWYIVYIGISQKKKTILYSAAFFALVLIIIYVHFTKDYNNAYEYSCILVFIYSAGVFLAINNINKIKAENKENIISVLSKLSFGIYVGHVFILKVITKLLPKTFMAPIYMLICWALTLLVSIAATYILSKIPYLKRIVRM